MSLGLQITIMYVTRRWVQMMFKFLKLGIFSFCICNPLLLLYLTRSRDQIPGSSNNQDLDCSQLSKSDEHKIILFWTPFFSRNDFEFGIGDHVFADAQCPVYNCITTTDRNMMSKAHAVVFHVRNTAYRDLPTYRSPCQRWIFFLYESPLNTHVNVNQYAGLFNWTMTYRLDADIGGPPALLEKLIAPVVPASKVNHAQNKEKFAAWFVSNCYTFSQREKLVEQLQQYVPVDVYGECGNFTCPREISSECFTNVEKHYKFYLSLENSICEDYITEKVFDILRYNVVPVVYGGGNYSKLLPPHSYIDAVDFDSVEHLANYLIKVNSNDTLYNSYFDWRLNYTLRRNNHWCTLCSKLNDDKETTKIYLDIDNWWNRNKNCSMGYEMKILGLNSFQKVLYWAWSWLMSFLLFKNA